VSEGSKVKGVDTALAAAALNGLTIRAAAAYLAEYFSAGDIAALDPNDSVKGSDAVASAPAPLHRKPDQQL
jgi:hypothetical protein